MRWDGALLLAVILAHGCASAETRPDAGPGARDAAIGPSGDAAGGDGGAAICQADETIVCTLGNCSAARQRCEAGSAWTDCTCACPRGGALMGSDCVAENKQCPPGGALQPDGQCVQQVLVGYSCPAGGALSGTTCVPSDASPRTDLACPVGGGVLAGVIDWNGRPHCALTDDLAHTGDSPVCSTQGGETYHRWDAGGFVVCVTEGEAGYDMVYFANHVLGGNQASYPATPLHEPQSTPATCPDGWSDRGGVRCGYPATLP